MAQNRVVLLIIAKKLTQLSGLFLLKLKSNRRDYWGKFMYLKPPFKAKILPINFTRSFSTSVACFCSQQGLNQRKERMKNYIIFGIGGLWVTFIASVMITAPYHADYVIVEADEKNN